MKRTKTTRKKCGKICYQSLAIARRVKAELVKEGRFDPDIRLYRCPFHPGKPWHHGHSEVYSR